MKEKIGKREKPKNQEENLNNMADSSDLVTKLLESLLQQRSDPFESLTKTIIIKDLLKSLKEEPAQQQSFFGPQTFTQMMQFAMFMQFFREFMKMTNTQSSSEDMMKWFEMYQKLAQGNMDAKTMMEMVNNMHRQYTDMIREVYKEKEEKNKEQMEKLVELVQEALERWDKEKLEMLSNFQETVQQLTNKGRFDELKKFLQEYQEYQQIEKQIKELFRSAKLEEEGLVKPEGGINWDKVLHIIEKLLLGSGGFSGTYTPAPKEVKPPSTETQLATSILSQEKPQISVSLTPQVQAQTQASITPQSTIQETTQTTQVVQNIENISIPVATPSGTISTQQNITPDAEPLIT